MKAQGRQGRDPLRGVAFGHEEDRLGEDACAKTQGQGVQARAAADAPPYPSGRWELGLHGGLERLEEGGKSGGTVTQVSCLGLVSERNGRHH